MIETVLGEVGGDGPTWIDISAPTADELDRIASERGFPRAALAESLASRQLPKHERLGDGTFVVVRVYDPDSKPDANSFADMTRKVSIFLGDRVLVTIHKRPLPFIETIKARMRASKEPVYVQAVMLEILLAAVETYHGPVEQAEHRVHEFAASLLEGTPSSTIAWKDIFRTKVRIETIKRLLWHTQNATQKYVPRASANQPAAEELRERIASLSFFAESLDDDLDNLLTVQLSLAANRTNDVMKLLTVSSAVFLPITFIVGVYGMNFEYMPEIHSRYGYAGVWLLILATVVGVLLWFKRRGWTG